MENHMPKRETRRKTGATDQAVRRPSKEELFEDFFVAADCVLPRLESGLGITNVWSQFMGLPQDAGRSPPFVDEAEQKVAKSNVRKSPAWASLSALYDYAFDGVVSEDATDIVLAAAEVLQFVTTDGYGPSDAWNRVVAMGDGRFALDDGSDVLIDKVALLASVDVRTVRNAVSTGELIANKSADGAYIENGSARQWLCQRKRFRPSVLNTPENLTLREMASPVQLGAYLRQQRERLGINLKAQKLFVMHSAINAQAQADIENGLFLVSLDAVFPLADFYQLNRKELLAAVMRTHFPEQLAALALAAQDK